MNFNRPGALKNYLVAAVLLAQAGCAWGEATAEISDRILAKDENPVAYDYRWRVTELPRGQVAPPLKLLWDKSPILTLFAWLNPGSYFSEIPGRRLADTPQGLVTVMKRTLYLLDKQDGSTLWSLQLQGTGITDWKVEGNVLAYTAAARERNWVIHAAVDLTRGKHLWLTRESTKMRYNPQWLMIVPGHRVIYGTDQHIPFYDTELTARDLRNGALQWKIPNNYDDGMSLHRGSWFVYKGQLYAITVSGKGDRFLRGLELASGKALPLLTLFDGEEHLGLEGVRWDGTLFFSRSSFQPRGKSLVDAKISLVAYSIDGGRLLWEAKLFTGEDTQYKFLAPAYTVVTAGAEPRKYPAEVSSTARHVNRVAISPSVDDPVVVAASPNLYVLVNAENGAIIKKQAIPGYVKWDGVDQTLYSYPYFFTTAQRILDKGGMACDLIALNLETGKVDWTYEIDSGEGELGNILNFVVSGNTLYVSKPNGRILAFQIPDPGKRSMGGK